MRTTATVGGVLVGLVLVVGLIGCGTNPETVSFIADERRTLLAAEEHSQKYCYILTSEICQSADSALFFHLPRELRMVPADRQMIASLEISNEGADTIVLAEYFIRVVDEDSRVYDAEFEAPNDYDETQPFSPALKLPPFERVEIPFVANLSLEAEVVKGIKITYRLPGDIDFSQVVVSYQAANLEQVLDERRNPEPGYQPY
ncbi:hypothetical protein GF377_10015 [candidate division GN15 bacterium]|nr:hypothetical protein [candidate division GN15 bacterium]